MEVIEEFHTNITQPRTQVHFWTWFWFSATVIASLTTVGTYYWQGYQNQVKQEVFVQDTNRKLIHKEQQMLKTICKPLILSIKTNLIAQKQGSSDSLLSNFSKLNHFSNIHVVDNKGKILLTNQPSRKNTSALLMYAPPLFVQDSIVILLKTDKIWTVSSPIFNAQKRLGTLFFDYQPYAISIDNQ